MNSVETVRKQVYAFFDNHDIGSRKREDAFAPWFMVQHFRLPPQEAIAQSSDGNYDGGIDAYHLERRKDEAPLLWIIQAKFSPQDAIVRTGIDDLRRATENVANILAVGRADMADQHQVIHNLRRDLHALSDEDRAALEVRCTLIHLLKDQEIWLSKPAVQKAKQDFVRAVGDTSLAGRVTITYRGPEEMVLGDKVPPPASPITLRFDGVCFIASDAERALFGLGHLADLVQLYEKYHAQLFAKNVRMYVVRQAAKPKSAANHIKGSLERICNAKMPASDFAMIHNGVTISVPRAAAPTDGSVVVQPGSDGVYVLNGCQTIKTAWEFYKKRLLNNLTVSGLRIDSTGYPATSWRC